MDEFPGLFSRDFGLRPQGKAAPMSASKRAATGSASGLGSYTFSGDLLGGDRRGTRRPLADDDGDVLFGAKPPKYASASAASFASDPFFSLGSAAKTGSSATAEGGFPSSTPVYDKPVYDDDDGDIFSGVPGVKKSSSVSGGVRGDVFASTAYADDLLASLGGSRPAPRGVRENGRHGGSSGNSSPPYGDDDLLANVGRSERTKMSEATPARASPPYGGDGFLSSLGGGRSYGDDKRSGDAFSKQSPISYEDDLLAGLGGGPKPSSDGIRQNSEFDDLIPGFGGRGPPKHRSVGPETKHQRPSVSSTKSTVTVAEDPFVVLESTSDATYSSGVTDPLELLGKHSGSIKSNVSTSKIGKIFDDINGFNGFAKSMPSSSSEVQDNNDRSPLETDRKIPLGKPSINPTHNVFQTRVPDEMSQKTLFEKSTKSSESFISDHQDSQNFDRNVSSHDPSSRVTAAKKPKEQPATDDEVWLTVDEIPLFTQPTNAPPPSRAPPPAVTAKQVHFKSQGEGSSFDLNARRSVNGSSFQQPTENYQFQNLHNEMPKGSSVSSLDELEEFAMASLPVYAKEAQFHEEENEANSTAAASAAAMKQAMDRAEAKFKHAREVREREGDWRSSKNREAAQQAKDEDRPDREREQLEREEKERRRLEKMRELELEREREREKARQAVERATREARERAAAEARQKAEKAAREQAARAAVQRAHAEARERAAAEAKDRAEKLAAEKERAEAEMRERATAEVRERAAKERAAREKAAMEAREKAERAAVERAAAEARARAQRAAVERATAEARERAAVEARERAAAMAREKQQKKDNDLDSFFGMGARANSAPRERSTPSESAFDAPYRSKMSSDENRKTASVSSSNIRRPSSTANIMDDLTSVFKASSNDEFQEVEGEPEERRRARLEREQRARQRAVRALAEKNEREMQMQREQAERDRISDTLNIEIRRWAAGKEGNLRALLSTLQYVLWPDSGWQPVSLTDLITGASVKKVYRKATLCVHPDKVVNGTVQQKYIAEKVFDLLKESWNKFNSEELF